MLQTLKWPDALDALLDRIADDARLAEQEMGLSTLFLAFGFLERSEADTSEKRHAASLLPLPLRLEKRKAAGRKTVFNLIATSEVPGGDAHHTVGPLPGERLGIGVRCTLNRLVTASAPLVRLCGARGDDARAADMWRPGQDETANTYVIAIAV